MSYYRDNRVTINAETISIRGIPIPVVSGFVIEKEDIKSISFRNRKLLSRLVMSGPVSMKTWKNFDPWTLLRNKEVVIVLKEKILSFEEVTLTFSNYEAACATLDDHYAEFMQEE